MAFNINIALQVETFEDAGELLDVVSRRLKGLDQIVPNAAHLAFYEGTNGAAKFTSESRNVAQVAINQIVDLAVDPGQ